MRSFSAALIFAFLAAAAQPDPVLERLAAVKTFAFGGVPSATLWSASARGTLRNLDSYPLLCGIPKSK